MKNKLTILFLFYSLTGFSQKDITDKVTDFSAECIETVFLKDSVTLEVETFELKKKRMVLEFTAGANCGDDKKGVLNIMNDTLQISNNNFKKEVEEYLEEDSTGRILQVTVEIVTQDYVFCDCKIRYSYNADNIKEKVRILDFNGQIVKLKKK